MPADVQLVYPHSNTGPDTESGPESGLTEESGADYSGDKEEEQGWSDSSTGRLSSHPSHQESSTESGNESGSLSGHAAKGEETSGSEEERDSYLAGRSDQPRPLPNKWWCWCHHGGCVIICEF